MNTKSAQQKVRNWFLVFIASILFIIGLALLLIAVTNMGTFGWWSLLIGLGGLITSVAATVSIVKNDPSWILLSLLIPG